MAGTFIQAIDIFAGILIVLIIARALLTWFPEPRRDSPIRGFYVSLLSIASKMTDPIIMPIRRLLAKSPLGGPGARIDFSPIFAYFLIVFVQNILRQLVVSIF